VNPCPSELPQALRRNAGLAAAVKQVRPARN
jgi:hypothetical protein